MSRLDKYTGETLRSETVLLDGRHFENCSFIGCEMRYSGGQAPVLIGCNFDQCTWSFASDAANTLSFLSGLYNGGLEELVEATFQSVKDSNFSAPPEQKSKEPKPRNPNTHPLVFRVPKIWKVPKG